MLCGLGNLLTLLNGVPMKFDSGKSPLNLKLMSGDRTKLKYLQPVTSSQIHTSSSTELDPNGVFSQDIFGRVGDPKRMKTLSYIDLHAKVMHPLLWKNMERISAWYTEIFLGKRYAIFDKKIKQFVPSDAIDGFTGPTFLLDHLNDLKFARNESNQRDLRIDVFEKYRGTAIYDYILLLPAGQRDLEEGRGGNLKCDDINDAYRSLVGLSKNIDKADKENVFNHRTQGLMQMQFNSIFDQMFAFLKGKGGFTASKWTKRKVEHGTRTVFSSMRLHSKNVVGPQRITINDCHIGLAQTLRGTLPLTLNKFSTRLASKVFNGDGTANLVDKKTLEGITVKVDPKWKELYTTEDGLLSLIKEFKVADYKFTEAKIQGYPIALIYRDENAFMIKNDILDFPEKFREKVRPITKFELYYYLAYDIDKETIAWVTRYPFADEGSMFPCIPYLKSTIVADALYEMDGMGNPTEVMFREFPIVGAASVETGSPHPNRLDAQDADFDGDTMSIEFCMTQEAIHEVKQYLKDPRNMISRGKFNALFSDDISEWMLRAYTSPKPVAI